MLASSFNAQSVVNFTHRFNKLATSFISNPSKGYTGSCPFLRGLSKVSGLTSGETSLQDELIKERGPFSCGYLEQHRNYSRNLEAEPKLDFESVSNQQDEANLVETSDIHQVSPEKSSIVSRDAKPIVADAYDYESKFDDLIDKKKQDGSYRVFRKVRRLSANFPYGIEQDKPVTIWCSNDYFGMSSHPKVREAVVQAVREFGSGSGGTRNIAGNSPVHEALEWEIADLHDKESALIFSSCYVANDSTLYTLLKLIPDCVIFSDAGNHASMIQGIRNSGAQRHIFKCFDPVDLEDKLRQVPLSQPKIVAFETVHSMTGDVSDVEKMCDISHKYGAITFVDEVHAVGLYGHRGAGIGQRQNCMHKIDIVSGTLGKAFGNFGGYIASSKKIVDVVRSYAAGFIFTTSLPPTVACGARESIQILKGDEGRSLRKLQQDNVLHMKRALTAAGLPHYNGRSHIVPIPIGNAVKCTQVSSDLLGLGHYIQSINYPTVPRGTERLRVSISPFHSDVMIDSLIEQLVAVWYKNDLDFVPPVEMAGEGCKLHMSSREINQGAGDSLWCQLCHKEVDFRNRLPVSL